VLLDREIKKSETKAQMSKLKMRFLSSYRLETMEMKTIKKRNKTEALWEKTKKSKKFKTKNWSKI